MLYHLEIVKTRFWFLLGVPLKLFSLKKSTKGAFLVTLGYCAEKSQCQLNCGSRVSTSWS